MQLKKNSLRYIELFILCPSLLFAYLMIVIGAWHCYPNAEEYELAAGARDTGSFRFMLNLLVGYDGRYATNFMHAFNPLTIDWIDGYKLLPITATLSFVLSLWYFLLTIIQGKSKWQILLLSLLISLCFMGTIPSLVCSLYWAGGSFVYLYPCTFLLLFMGSVKHYLTAEAVSENLFFVLTCVSLIVGIGFNEMFLPAYVLLLIGILGYSWMVDKRWFYRVLPVAMVGISCIVFFVASPGVSARIESSEKVISAKIFTNNLQNLSITLREEISNPLMFFSLLYASTLFINQRLVLRLKISNKKIVACCICVFILTYLMCVAYYLPKQSMYGYPERIYAPVVFLFVVSQFILLAAGVSNRFQQTIFRFTFGYVRIFSLVALLFFLINGNNNFSTLYKDFRSKRMEHFKTFMDTRIRVLQSVSKSNATYKAVLIPKLGEDYPTSIYKYPDVEIERSNSIWNKYHEAYFRLDEINVEGDTTFRF